MGAQPSQFQVATTEGTIELPPSNNKKTDPILQQVEQRKTTERIFSQEEEYSPQVRRAIKIGFSLLVSITILVLISFLIVISKRANNNNDDASSDDEANNISKGKLIFCIVWMLLSSLGLAIVGGLFFFGNTMPSRYRAGMLGGSMLGYANMAFMCALLFVNFQVRTCVCLSMRYACNKTFTKCFLLDAIILL